jgi:3-dehydroquinate synthetase
MAVLHKIVKLVKNGVLMIIHIYDIGQNLLNQKALLSKQIPGKQVMIVTNTTVEPLYLAKVIFLPNA